MLGPIMSSASVPSMLSKFKGCLVGAVLVGTKILFTDDTAMARSVAKSLIECKEFNANDMASKFADEYRREPDRGYGGSVTTVFNQLGDPQLADVFQPAREQFNGEGSYGNGGAMRIMPAPLFGVKLSDKRLQELVTNITRITHTHKDSINGAILESLAIHRALYAQTTSTDAAFLKDLASVMDTLEVDKSRGPSYTTKLQAASAFIDSKETTTIGEVVDKLGNDVSAFGSVPAAVYSFLKATQPIEELAGRDSPFERAVIYPILLGGDTDTIASMSGAIAGAFYGIEAIPTVWSDKCEGVSDALDMAVKLYDIVQDK